MSTNLLETLSLPDLQSTDQLGKLLAEQLPTRGIVGLVGTLGAGKTRLVQALATHAGVPARAVTSPTFTLIQPYQGLHRTIYHIDAYRIADDDEYWELGIEELCETEALVVMEWADRFASMLPRDTLWLQISVDSETARTVEFSGLEVTWGSTIARIVAEISSGQSSI